ncbi:MAG: hypothetical protein HBSIN02_21420 [Bacteroidia bacterium]|nr:MAG: hypothetical protein HBSIN02_21420 [Bacteroidia bacterium]
MKNPLLFAKRVFLLAGIYGLVVIIPLYFSEHPQGIDYPPDITHPEWYYGFAGAVTAWAVMFLFLSRDPLRYRPLMIPSMLEKLLFPPAVLVLYLQGRLPDSFLPLALIDFSFAVAFFIAYKRTKNVEPS